MHMNIIINMLVVHIVYKFNVIAHLKQTISHGDFMFKYNYN